MSKTKKDKKKPANRYVAYWQEAFRDWWYLLRREMRLVFRDEGVVLFFIVVPWFYPIVYSLIYTSETLREVPAAVVDNSRTAMSREYLRNVDASADVHIISYCANMQEAQELVRQRAAYGIISVPRSFATDIMQGRQTHVSVFCDMSGLLYYKAMLTANTNVSLKMNAAIKVQRAQNTTDREDEVTVQPIAYEDVNLYNPQAGIASFLLPGVLVLIIQQTLLLGIAMMAGTSRERNRLHELIPVGRHNHGLLRIVWAKTSVYLTIYVVQSVFCFGVVPRIFSLPQIGNPITMAFFFFPFLLAVIFFGMTVSAVVRERENGVLIFVFTSVILIFISGLSWPSAAIPGYWKIFSYIFPSTFAINGFVHINNMGASLLDVRKEWDALWLQAAFYFFTCCLSYRYKILAARIRTYKDYRARRVES
ncbi:MAG: ABC transporter permease [Bacteroidaceae bacterium]|nr:ABC transporter permease [Bacteroidaceae bacterium]